MGLSRPAPIHRDDWYSAIEIKSIDDEQRIVRGIATTPTPDRGDHVVNPFGVKFTNPIPFLLNHDKKAPVGQVYLDRPTKAGITFTAHIPKVVEPGIVRDRTDEAWHSFKYGLLRGASIGWRPITIEPLGASRIHLKEIEVLEVSGVTIPMNAETTITAIKSLDAPYLAALGESRVPFTPGATGIRKGSAMTPYSEQIESKRGDLQTKSSRLEDLMTKDETESGLNAEETKELDALTDGVKELTRQIGRLEALESAQATQARVVGYPAHMQGFQTQPGRVSQQQKAMPRVEVPALPKGTLFTRYAMAIAAGRGSISDAIAYAKRWEAQTPEVIAYIKAEAGTVDAGSPGWGSQLVVQETITSEFVELLRHATVLDKLEGMRRVPPNVLFQVQTGGSTVNWVGEEAVKPVTELDFSTTSIGDHKIAGIVVLTEELVRSSKPSAEETVRRDLVEQIARFIDAQFLTPTVTATSTRPAAITNGISSPAATGTDADALLSDLNTALATFDDAEVGQDTIHIVMPPALARGISTLRNALGQTPDGFGVTPRGGSLLGYKVIVSGSVPSGTIIIIKADEIFLADEGRVRLDASNQATLDMAGGGTPNFSLWQRNCIGIRAERFISYKVRRATGSVAIIDTASYGPAAGSP